MPERSDSQYNIGYKVGKMHEKERVYNTVDVVLLELCEKVANGELDNNKYLVMEEGILYFLRWHKK